MRSGLISAVLSLALICAICITGCDKKITPEEKAIIATVGLDSTERAAAWDIAATAIVSVNPSQKDTVARFCANQSTSLHALASGLNSLGDAITNGSNLSQNARDALSQAADTATARAADLRAMRTYITADAATLAFLDAHQAALQSEADSLNQLKALFAADSKPKPKATVCPVPAK